MMMWMACAWAGVTADAEVQLSMRPGLAVSAATPIHRGITVGGAVAAIHDPGWLNPAGLDFERRQSLRLQWRPSLGLWTQPGSRDRWDLFTDLQVGPELLYSRFDGETAGGIAVADRGTRWTITSSLRTGVRLPVSERAAVVLSLSVPVAPGLAGGAVPPMERVVLGVGMARRPTPRG